MTVDKTRKMMYNSKIIRNHGEIYKMKKLIIRIISLTLVILMCLGALASCSTNTQIFAKSAGGNKISLAMYSLITSLMKGNDAYYIVQQYGSYNSETYWNKIVDAETQMTMKEYYQYMIDLKIKYYLAALDLFDELGLELTDEEIAAIDADMAEFVEIDGDGSKNKLNTILSEFGANYKTLREYKIMNAKISKLSTYLYGTNASKISDEIKQEFMEKNYVAFKMILLPTYDYKYIEDKYGNPVYYTVDADGKVKTAKAADGKTYNIISYDSAKGIELDTDSDGKNDVDLLGHTVYYTYNNVSIAYNVKNGVTGDKNNDGNTDKDKYGNNIYYVKDSETAEIAYDTEKGGALDIDGDGELDKDSSGNKIYYDYDLCIAYNTASGVRINETDKNGAEITEEFSAAEKAKVKEDAEKIFGLAENGNFDSFEELLLIYDNNYSIETEEERDSLIYLSADESYTAGSELMNDLYGKIAEAKVGDKIMYESDYGYHIIMRYEAETGAYNETKYEFYFESFVSNLTNELFFARLDPYLNGITIKEKYKEKVDIATMTPNYNFY